MMRSEVRRMMEIVEATISERTVLYNLLEKYLYEFSQWEKTDFCRSKFFILYKFRRCGCGREAVRQVLDRHRGRWQLKCHPHNVASVRFWNKVIAEYSGGNYRLVEGYLNAEVDYEDGTPANVYFFEN